MQSKSKGAAEPVPFRWGLEGTVEVFDLESAALKGNPLGDPHVRPVYVYLPPEYRADPGRRFPVIHYLTGFTGTGGMMLNLTSWAPNLPQRFEKLRAGGEAEPAILVLPDCFTRLGGSQYLDSSATGRYETHLIEEVVPEIDARYRTLADRAHRGVMGKSSGGYGALVQGMRHSDLFSAIACQSGDMAFEYCYLPDFPKTATALWRHGGLLPFLRAFEEREKKSQEMMTAINVIAMASCYSPNPDRPGLGFDLPFDEETGALRGEVWERWLAHDPVRMIEEREEALRRAALLFLDCGIRDEFNLHVGARIFRQRLREKGIPHVHEEFDDGHMKINYRYDRSLALLSRTLSERD
ncbi:MAG: esterase [Candidatus Eisenbacteria bacterium]|nr:esterase [Candidatus Latescibacterota bacterium]MBD3303010.1 esterase [Candidatus Eisenbacteria bacterium]